MAPRRFLGCLWVATLAMCALTACKSSGGDSKEDAGEKTAPEAETPLERLGKRCQQLGRACGEKDKHYERIVEDCREAAKQQAEKGCTDKAVAVYDCYEKEICGAVKKVWAMDDFRVLVERHGKCVAERAASDACVGNGK